jgi:hypothetical protein
MTSLQQPQSDGAAVPKRRTTVPLLLLALVADGYDTAAFAFVVPTLAREWGCARWT